MSGETEKLLKEISDKLDQLVILGKLTNKNVLDSYQKEIKGDTIYSKLVEYADGTVSSSDLVKKVAVETGSAEITVKKDRVKHWMDRGAKPSDTVNSILKKEGFFSNPSPA